MLNKKPLSDRDLRFWFHTFNRKYFQGKLSNDVEVRYSRGDKYDREHLGGALGTTHKKRYRSLGNPKKKVDRFIILLSKKYKKSRRLTLATLLHEMVHVKTWYTTSQHACDMTGWNAFNKESLRIAKMGAFNGVW